MRRLCRILPVAASLLGAAAPPPIAADPAGPGRRIEGSVTAPGGSPIGGAAVLLRYSTRLRPGHVRQLAAVADAEGRFRFAGLPADAAEARVAAHAPGRGLATPAEGVPADPAPGAPALRVVLEPRAVLRIAFRVPAGLPPAEGAVSLEPDGRWVPFAGSEALITGSHPASAPAGPAGAPAGAPAAPSSGHPVPVGVRYHSEAYGGGVFFTSLAPGRSKDTIIDLAAPDWMTGLVLDERNTPVEGVLYRAENAFRGMASATGADGVFRIRRLRAGAARVQFRDPRFRDTVLALGRASGGSGARPVELRLDRGAPAITGRVAPRAGRPEDCLAEARPLDPRKGQPDPGRSRWPGGEVRRAVPGPDGAFSLGGLDPETYQVRVDCPAAGLREDTAAPGATLAPAAPGPARPLMGRVLAGEGGAPVAAFRFHASGIRPESPEAALAEAEPIADSLGRFVLSRRFEGVNHICASAPGFAPACRAVAEGDTLPAAILLERGHVLRVKAVGSGPGGDTGALAGARVRVRRVGAKGPGWSGEADGEGRFQAPDLGRGEYAVDVREGGRMAFRKVVELAGDSEVVARLAPGAALEGTLRQWDGKPPRGLRILARHEWPSGEACPAAIVESPVRPDGSFSLQGLGGCPATLGVAAAWSRSAPFLPLWRSEGRIPGEGPLALELPKPRVWEITAVSGGSPLPVDAEVHILVPPLSDSLPGEALGHPLGRTAFRGTWSFTAFEGVRYVATVGARGYRERADTLIMPPGEEPYETRMELDPWPGARGRLAWKAGEAAPSLEGWTARGPGGVSAPVEADGSFRLEGTPPGPAPVEIRDGEGRLVRCATARSAGPEAAVPPADSLREWPVLALDLSGRPVAGAAVIFRRREFPGEAGRAIADGAGRLAWKAPAGAWLACPEDPALACTRLPDGPAPGEPAVVRLGRENSKVTVSFQLPMPMPMRGSAVLVGPWGSLPPAESRDGELLHPRLAFPARPGRSGVVAAAAAWSPSPAIQYWAAEPLEAGQASLAMPPPGPGVQVTAADSGGRPLRGVTLRFLPRQAASGPGPGRPWGEAEGWRTPASPAPGTDAAGGLLCLGVRPGRYWIYASHPTHACAPLAWDRPREAAAAVSLSLRPGSPIRVKVTHEGYPASGARVEVYDSLGNRAAPAAWAQRDGGIVECGAFPPGRYRVAVAAPGLGRLVKEADAAPGSEVNLEAALPAAGWLEITGEGLEDREFYLKGPGSRVTPLVRHAEIPPRAADGRPGGSLLFHGIPPERYELWMEGGREGLGEVEIRAAGLSVLEVGRLGKVRVALPSRRG